MEQHAYRRVDIAYDWVLARKRVLEQFPALLSATQHIVAGSRIAVFSGNALPGCRYTLDRRPIRRTRHGRQ
jgi:hypothetical protein